MYSRIPTSTLFPYTTLFRSLGVKQEWTGEWSGITETTCSLNAVDISRQLQNGYALQVTAWHKGRKFQWIEFEVVVRDRKRTRLNSSHRCISYAVFCLKKKKK